MKIEQLNYKSEKYPNLLKNIYDYPKKLYVLGNKELLNQKCIAIVGGRNATEYGKSIALKFAKELSQRGINIVSGLAIGIDSYAHLGALCSKGKTIAVLGSGIDEIYPKENIELARRIVKNEGCLISEYPLGTKPEKLNFPQRNRIISGISLGVLVIEAKENSGSLITADFAIEQGKDVFVAPGNITSPMSVGSNNLIKQGAKLVTNFEDILCEIQ